MMRRSRHARGFSMIEILASVLIFSVAMLGLAGMYMKLITAQTQNQNISVTATWSNSFWGIVQANVGLAGFLGGLPNTYTASNINTAPAPLQNWLTQVLLPPYNNAGVANVNGSLNALPNGSVTIATGPDAVSGLACSSTTGCTVTLTFQWTQNGGAPGTSTTRSQVFTYQIGL